MIFGRPKAQRLRQMHRLNIVAPCQIRNRACQLQDAMTSRWKWVTYDRQNTREDALVAIGNGERYAKNNQVTYLPFDMSLNRVNESTVFITSKE